MAHFVIGQERDCHEVYTSLLKLSQPGIWDGVCFSNCCRAVSWKACLSNRESFACQTAGFAGEEDVKSESMSTARDESRGLAQ